jgi:hypothetical protein
LRISKVAHSSLELIFCLSSGLVRRRLRELVVVVQSVDLVERLDEVLLEVGEDLVEGFLVFVDEGRVLDEVLLDGQGQVFEAGVGLAPVVDGGEVELGSGLVVELVVEDDAGLDGRLGVGEVFGDESDESRLHAERQLVVADEDGEVYVDGEVEVRRHLVLGVVGDLEVGELALALEVFPEVGQAGELEATGSRGG